MTKRVTGTTFNRATFVKRGAVRNPNDPSEPFGRLIWKAEDDPALTGGASAPSTTPKGATMTDQEHQAALAKAEKERDEALRKAEEAEQKLAKASKKSDEDDDDKKKDDDERNPNGEFVKSELPEPVRVALEKAEQREAEALKKAEEAERIAKEERDLRLTREFITKAETEFPHLGDAQKLGPRLMKMEAVLSKEEYDEHLRELAAANEQIAKGDLFKEMGVGNRGGAAQKQDGVKATLAKAEELRKADSSLTEAEAFRRAASDPDVQKAYLAEVA